MVVLCEYRFSPDSPEQALLAGAHPFQLLSAVNWVDTALLTGVQDGGEARLSASPR